MDFEKAYQKFLDGSASPEELEFVRSEMAKANAINEVLDNIKKEGAIKEAEEEKVKEAIKKYNFKSTIRILIIVGCSLVVLLLIIGAAIGIPILSNAKSNMKYSKAEAKEIAIEYVKGEYPEYKDNIIVREVEKELEVPGRIKNAHYIYVVEIYNGRDNVIEIEIDSKSGQIIDVDFD